MNVYERIMAEGTKTFDELQLLLYIEQVIVCNSSSSFHLLQYMNRLFFFQKIFLPFSLSKTFSFLSSAQFFSTTDSHDCAKSSKNGMLHEITQTSVLFIKKCSTSEEIYQTKHTMWYDLNNEYLGEVNIMILEILQFLIGGLAKKRFPVIALLNIFFCTMKP